MIVAFEARTGLVKLIRTKAIPECLVCCRRPALV
jgi:hypothetical protein